MPTIIDRLARCPWDVLACFHFCGPTRLLAVYRVMLQRPLCWNECKSATQTKPYNRKWFLLNLAAQMTTIHKSDKAFPQKRFVIPNVNVFKLVTTLLYNKTHLHRQPPSMGTRNIKTGWTQLKHSSTSVVLFAHSVLFLWLSCNFLNST